MKNYLNNIWRILATLCVVLVVGCSALGEHFSCSSEEEEKLNNAAHTKSQPRVMRMGLGAYAEGGDICRFNEPCIEEYVAMKAEFAKELMVWKLRFDGRLPGYLKDVLRKQGVASKNIETTDKGVRLHSRDITKIYWCAWREVDYYCKKFGITTAKQYTKRSLEDWEPPLSQAATDYEAVYGEKYKE